MKSNKRPSLTLVAASLVLACGAMGSAQAAATIVINNLNEPGVGFNDATPAKPVGGNTGTTLGQQRLIAFTHAANIWGATLTTTVPIVVNAQFVPLACTATGAVLGSAGATQVFADFPGAPKAAPSTRTHWRTSCMAEISDTPGPQINARFNSELGKANCLAGSSFYLGLDANEGANIDFVATLLHEMGHGLGFQTFTNGATGAQFAGYPSVWDHNLLDNTTNKLWVNMTNAERAASSLKPSGLSWTGARVTAAVPSVLAATPQLRIVGAGAKSLDGDLFAVGEADFGPKLDKSPVTGQIAQVALQADSPGSACTPFNAANAAAVRRNIALVSRGTCGFAVKVKNAQDAGAIGVIVADNAPGAVTGMGGADASITIPAVRVTQTDGALIAASLTKPNGSLAGTVGKMERSKTQLSGADAQRRITMFTPNPYQPGSSVSHYNTSATRNQLMEPSISADLTHTVTAPVDLTFELFKDIGW